MNVDMNVDIMYYVNRLEVIENTEYGMNLIELQ